MRTSHPVATISYNTIPFLDMKLAELMKVHKVEFYFYMYHLAEIDEGSNHIHLWIKPNKMIDTMEFQEFFLEPDPHNSKPLACKPFDSSKMADALLYFMHDPTYLKYKKQSREYHYAIADFHSPDPDYMIELHRRAWYESDFADWRRKQEVLEDALHNPADLILRGEIPLQQAGSLYAFKKLSYFGLDRNGRNTHTPKEERTPKEVDIRGICDDAYCPDCGYSFLEDETDFEYCPKCKLPLIWDRWHKLNDNT